MVGIMQMNLILRQQHGFMVMASEKKIYAALGGPMHSKLYFN